MDRIKENEVERRGLNIDGQDILLIDEKVFR